MAKWKISEAIVVSDEKSELFVYSTTSKKECFNKESLKLLIDNKELKFSLVYNNTKMVGYHFEYINPPKEHHVITNRMVSWFFNGKKKNPEINVLFEDQNIRLLSYIDESEGMDYWLVGRWRDID